MTPSCGAAPYASSPDDARDEDDTPARTTGSASRVARDGRSPSSSHAKNADDDDLEVAEDGGQPGPDRLDGVVPEHQVAGEEDARDSRQADRLARQRAVATPLPEGDQDEQRQPEDRAVERPGRGRDRGEQVEDPRERDACRAEERREARPLGEPVERRRARPLRL